MLPFINNNLIKTVIFILLFAMFTPIAYGDKLDYQDRGDRWEGVKPRPVAGQDIELLSVLAYYGEKWQSMPTHCKLKFYLPEQQKEVNLKVRELRPKHFYWMDKVIPKSPLWRKGFNEYQWPTEDVIKPLKLDISTLGVVVRLEKQFTGESEKVAPVIFYHSTPPNKILGYLFTFKVGETVKLHYTLALLHKY